jgi:hypothetical protein
VANQAEPEENFGRALFAANFGDGTRVDLAVGVPDETLNEVVDAGAVHVFYGRAGGFTGVADAVWHRGTTGVRGDPGSGDHLGAALR